MPHPPPPPIAGTQIILLVIKLFGIWFLWKVVCPNSHLHPMIFFFNMANNVVFMTNKVTEMCDIVTLDISDMHDQVSDE